MSETQARLDLYTIVSGVSNVGSVYDIQKWSNDWSTFLNHFKTTISGSEVIRGWCITGPLQVTDSGEGFAWAPHNGRFTVTRTYTYLIRGVVGHKDTDSTEKTAASLMLEVVKALNTSTTLHNGSRYDERTPLAGIDVFEPRVFGGVLCHYIEIRQSLMEGVNLGA